MTADPSHYDSMPYESYAWPQSHPDRLATVATLFGMQPQPINGARVLELGCAVGGNLLPMAAAHPESEFVGVDLSAPQIAEGEAGIAAAGLSNVRLHAMSLADIGAELGQFDYIIAHGVYSWVPAEVRDQLLLVCARHLAPMGVAYISYNTLPGSDTRTAVREMVRLHTRRTSSPGEQLRETRALFGFLRAAFAERDDAYALRLSEELAQTADLGDLYLAHEYLEETNQPCYFHEFARHAGEHGLQFLGESEIQAMSATDLGPAAKSGLRQTATSLIEAEQYLDLLRNRAFRQTLLCRADVELKRAISPALVEQFHFASSVPGADGSTPLGTAALHELHTAWPRALSFSELATKAAARAGVPADRNTTTALSTFLLQCYASTPAIEFQLWPPVFQPAVSEFPAATALARWQATRGARVANARHETVLLGPAELALLARLDGTHSLAALTAENPAAAEILAQFAGAALLAG